MHNLFVKVFRKGVIWASAENVYSPILVFQNIHWLYLDVPFPFKWMLLLLLTIKKLEGIKFWIQITTIVYRKIWRKSIFNTPLAKHIIFHKLYSRWTFTGSSWIGGGQKGSPPQNLSHISYNDQNWHSYTLPKEDPKHI